MADLAKIKQLSDWPKVREKIEPSVRDVLGKLPRDDVDLQVKVIDEQDFPGYMRRKINYFVDEWSRISSWLFIPESPDPCPAIICLHQATEYGKDEPAGLEGDAALAFAKHYALMGYVTLAPDCVTAGERVSVGLEPYDTTTFYKDSPKSSVIAKMLIDHIKCIDILSDADEVDPARIGVVGHDIGAVNALFLAAFDDRIRACVSSCGITSMEKDKDPMRWAREEGMVLMPKLGQAIQKGKIPFDWDEVLALIAPSPTLLINARNDTVLSNSKSCEGIVKSAKKVYGLLGEPDALEIFSHGKDHTMPQQALDAADDWFDRWL